MTNVPPKHDKLTGQPVLREWRKVKNESVKGAIEEINAETDLRTATINYYTALYNVLASKVDVQKELGQFNY